MVKTPNHYFLPDSTSLLRQETEVQFQPASISLGPTGQLLNPFESLTPHMYKDLNQGFCEE